MNTIASLKNMSPDIPWFENDYDSDKGGVKVFSGPDWLVEHQSNPLFRVGCF